MNFGGPKHSSTSPGTPNPLLEERGLIKDAEDVSEHMSSDQASSDELLSSMSDFTQMLLSQVEVLQTKNIFLEQENKRLKAKTEEEKKVGNEYLIGQLQAENAELLNQVHRARAATKAAEHTESATAQRASMLAAQLENAMLLLEQEEERRKEYEHILSEISLIPPEL